MRTNLHQFAVVFANKNWAHIWKLDGQYLTNLQAHLFVRKAIEGGYETDEDVPEDLVREWLKNTNKGKTNEN